MLKKKIIAGVATLALALGMVALATTSASAHHNTISATVSCTNDYKYQISWSVKNSESDKSETITASNRTNAVPVGATLSAGETKVFTEVVTDPANLTLTLSAKWSNNVTHTDEGSVSKDSFGNCDPGSVPVTLCHADPTNTAANGWSVVNAPDGAAAVSTHEGDSADIIPAFTYWSKATGVWTAVNYPGKNLGTNYSGFTGAQILAFGCAPTITPPAPTFTPAVCTGPGTAGDGSYTIPATAGVQYSVRLNNAGGYVDKAAGVYSVPVGTFIQVKATAVPSWVTLSGTKEWSHTFISPGDCILIVTPVEPTAHAISECGAYGTLTMPTTTGVVYELTTGDGKQGAWLVTATPAAGYKFTGPQTVTFGGNLGTFTMCVTPAPPTFVNAECTGPGTNSNGTYTIPSTAGVTYQVKIGSEDWVTVPAGTYPVSVFPTTIQVKAIANTGYTLKNSAGPWTHTFSSAGPCLVESSPVDPEITVITECGKYGSVVFPPTVGVVYTFTKGDGTHGEWEVTATPAAGYYFDGDATVVFSGDVGKYRVCVTPQQVTFANSECEIGIVYSGTFTIPSVTGVQYSVSINGAGYIDYPAGNYEAADGDLVVVEANPMPGYSITGTDSWSHTFADVGECELPTLGLAVPTISSTPITCSAAGSYTVGGGINGEHVVWTLEGSATPIPFGTYAVTTPQTIKLVATSDDPLKFGLADNESNPWVNPTVLTFAAPSNALCSDLPTLALTGTGVSVLGIALAAGLMVLGVAGIVLRRRYGVNSK